MSSNAEIAEIVEMKAIQTFGHANQIAVAIQELSELTKELSKFLRVDDEVDLDHLAEEMADVEIAVEEMKYVFLNRLKVQDWKNYKIQKLSKTIEEAENGQGVQTDKIR